MNDERQASKVFFGTIFNVFGITRPGIQPDTSLARSECSNHFAIICSPMCDRYNVQTFIRVKLENKDKNRMCYLLTQHTVDFDSFPTSYKMS